MSRKLATIIKDSAIPGKYKRVLEAYAAFANNDGTNIYPSQEKLGKKAGTSADTFQRVTPDLIVSGILKRAETHGCRVAACRKGSWHFSGHWGRSTKVYEIQIGNLQNAVSYLTAKCGLVNAAKCRKVKAAKCGTTQALIDSAPATPTLGKEPDSSASSPSGSEIASKPVTLADEPLASDPSAPASPESQNLRGVGDRAEQCQKQNQPQTPNDIWAAASAEEKALMFAITPNVTDAMILGQLGYCSSILRCFAPYAGDDVEYQSICAKAVLKWNRAHRSGKYASKDDKKLYIRTAAQFLRALESQSAALINDYEGHEFTHCEVCKVHSISHFSEEIDKLEREAQQRADEEKDRAERERIAKLCPLCHSNEPGETMYGAAFVCDSCYDEKYEDQQPNTRSNKLKPRPGYVPPKFDVRPAAVKDREYLENKAWFLQNGKNGEWALSLAEQAVLGVGVPHIAAVFRYMRRVEITVTKDEFIELLLECARKNTSVTAFEHVRAQ